MRQTQRRRQKKGIIGKGKCICKGTRREYTFEEFRDNIIVAGAKGSVIQWEAIYKDLDL